MHFELFKGKIIKIIIKPTFFLRFCPLTWINDEEEKRANGNIRGTTFEKGLETNLKKVGIGKSRVRIRMYVRSKNLLFCFLYKKESLSRREHTIARRKRMKKMS